MRILGIIPARGGSKSIPRKNIKDLGGKPLIAWTIDAAKEARVLDRLILTTDDEEIAGVGKRHGVEAPFLRPKELGEDHTPTMPVLQHAARWLRENENYRPDAVMLLQPTAPFRQARHIKEAAELFEKSEADSLVSVVEIPGHLSPYWAVVTNDEGWAHLFDGKPVRRRIPRRQEFPRTAYAHNGAIYLFKTELLFHPEEPNLYGDKVKLYPMERKYSANLDSPDDWAEAEIMVSGLNLTRFIASG